MKKCFLVLLAFASFIQSHGQFWGDLKMGPSAVGFGVKYIYDYSRTFGNRNDSLGNPVKGERARPIQVCVWAPIPTPDKITGLRIMLYEDYMYLSATEFTHGKLNDSLKEGLIKDMIQVGYSKAKINKAMNNPMYARINSASLSKGKHPVIIYACSWSAPSCENYLLAEYLASNGYVVLSCPSMGANSREMTGDMSGVEAQVEDLQFLINYASTLSYADMNNVGTAGFSWGGLTDILLQQKNNKIAAVICYDGTIANPNGMDHFKNYPSASYGKMSVPFMYMSMKGRKVNAFYEKLNYSDAYSITFHKNNHRDFCSSFIKTLNEYKNDTIEGLKIKDYEWQCMYSLNFFNAYMKSDKQALEFISTDPKEHGIPDTLLTLVSKKAKPLPPNEQQFLRLLRTEGTQKARALYEQVHAADPDYQLFAELSLNSLGYEFYKQDKLDQAIEILQLNAEAYPSSANVYDSLADAWLKKGDKDKAIENYKKALEINPNFASKSKLEKLQGQK